MTYALKCGFYSLHSGYFQAFQEVLQPGCRDFVPFDKERCLWMMMMMMMMLVMRPVHLKGDWLG